MKKHEITDEMVTRFLNWPLPPSVLPDPCVMDRAYPHRIGTHLLTADEARQMLEHVLQPEARERELPPGGNVRVGGTDA